MGRKAIFRGRTFAAKVGKYDGEVSQVPAWQAI